MFAYRKGNSYESQVTHQLRWAVNDVKGEKCKKHAGEKT